MSTTDYSVKLTLGYEGTDFERAMTIKGVDSVSATASTVKSKVQAVNASLSGGTDGGLSNFILSDDYDASESIGALKEIKTCVIDKTTKTVLI